MLYIPLAGWAMLAALILRSLAHRLTRDRVFRLGGPSFVTASIFVFCASVYIQETDRRDRETRPVYLQVGAEVDRTIRELSKLALRPPPKGRVALLHDPIPDSYGSVFIAYLLWDDPSLYIRV